MNVDDFSADKLLAKFKQERDELKLKLHLAKEDISDDWEALEQKVDRLEEKLGQRLKGAKSQAAESAEDVEAAAKLLGEELGDAFSKIKKRLKG